MMNKEVMAKTAQLDQFDEELYKVRLTCDTVDLLRTRHYLVGHRI